MIYAGECLLTPGSGHADGDALKNSRRRRLAMSDDCRSLSGVSTAPALCSIVCCATSIANRWLGDSSQTAVAT